MRRRLFSPDAALTAVATIVAIAWAGFLVQYQLEGRASVLDRIEAPLLDLRFLIAGPRPAPADVVIVAIDEEAIREAGRYPLTRSRMARLVRELARCEPKAIGLDVLFVDSGPAEGDQALAEALGQARAVVAAAALFGRGETVTEQPARLKDLPQAERVLWPIEPVRRVTGVGLVNVTTDDAGTPRHVPLLLRAENAMVPSFPLRLAMAAADAEPVIDGDGISLGPRTIRTDLGLNLPLRFYGPRGSVRTVSAAQVLRGALPQEELRGRVVVVGATALGAGDTFASPFDPVLPGVEVLATAVAHLVAGDGLVRTAATRRIDAAVSILLAVATILLLRVRPIGLGIALIVAQGAGWVVLTFIAFAQGTWLSMSVPLAAALPPAILYVGARLWLDQRIERRLEAAQETLLHFQPRALAEELVNAPGFLAEPVQQNAAIVFLDLSGFTGQSERLGPERTRDLLKELHSIIDEEVTRCGGLVLSYMGDGAMIVFGLPQPRDDDPARAVEAALALADRVSLWRRSRSSEPGKGLGVRLGAHYGPVIVSRLGGHSHQHITATGDSVNVASRLQEVAAGNKARVAVSADLFDAAEAALPAEARQDFGPERTVPIRGRAQPLVVRLWT